MLLVVSGELDRNSWSVHINTLLRVLINYYILVQLDKIECSHTVYGAEPYGNNTQSVTGAYIKQE